MVIVRTFDNYFVANIILTKLESYGIEGYLKDEYTVTMDPIISNAIGGIKLVVKEEDEPVAMELLQQFDEEYLNSAVCTKCGRSEIILIPKVGTTNFLTAILTWAFASYAIAPNYVYQCGSCKNETATLPGAVNEEDVQV